MPGGVQHNSIIITVLYHYTRTDHTTNTSKQYKEMFQTLYNHYNNSANYY